jgi:toxin ParE1/3/4
LKPILRRTPAAERDLDAIWSYVAARNPAAADQLYWRLENTADSLAASPRIGAPRPELGEGIRLFPVRRYLILYREIAGGIEVLRYLHSARDVRRLRLDPG